MNLQIGEGSITVFLTILFLLFFSLVGSAFEHVRVLSCEGYLRVAAHSAAMTVFGDYNRELYEDYGLFAYGGCDGKTADDLADDFFDIFLKNIQYAPNGDGKLYGNIYRVQDISALSLSAQVLTEKEIFLKQIASYLKSNVIEDITDSLLEKTDTSIEMDGMKDKLSMSKEYEEGRFDSDEDKKEGATPKTSEEDTAGGNPLEVFKDLIRDGILNLLCNVSTLSDGSIIAREEDLERDEKGVHTEKKNSAAEYFYNLIGDSQDDMTETWDSQKKTSEGLNKIKYISYGKEQFSCYTEDKERTTKYGMEYLLAGKREEKDNLSYVVNKLIRIRLLLNFAIIVTDSALQQKSMVTATTLAGFTGMPPVIYAVQYLILLILAFEEACVDVTALLEGRAVPLVKNVADLKVRYEEICLVSKSLFRKKAAQYSEAENMLGRNVTYKQYLWMFLLGESLDDLHERSLDLIQYDLREKYNQTFKLKTSICSTCYLIRYKVPFLFEQLPFLSEEKEAGIREMEVDYEYNSR